ncbi:glycosyltransferase family 4 protein [Gillisia sp. M10.2A]|uniref:Glycosyltransferase family 4 protein n=1 Tax=Gillisia lutea TaxID=2909668 RepID=A0ABS9EGZ6_9FLAO|nr:glycosyltransferase family 4 protein [Gillisia lutea]MCF4102131.1 glycosyltransferase family 4 protein [Gillisia lutea]
MHIGFITTEYPHNELPSSGGLGTSIKNLAEALVVEGVKVSVFVVGTEIKNSFQENAINFHFIKRYKVPLLTWFVTRKHYQKEISKIVKNDKIDILEAPDWTGITAFMNFKIPLIIRCNGSDAYFCHLEGRKQKWKNYWFEKNALKNADAVLAASNFTGKITSQLFSLDNEIITIYNGIDTKVFNPLCIEVKENSILYFGTIIRKKGVFELAKAFNILKVRNPEVVLKLIGKDSEDIFQEESSLELFYKMIDSKFLKDISYSSHLPYEEIKAEISKAGVVVLPSFAEAFPMTWLEAMAMGKALVTSNIGWAKEMMLNGVTGFMVDPKDHEVFADRINTLLVDDNLNINLGKQARSRVVQHFSSEITTKRSMDFYKKLIDNQ